MFLRSTSFTKRLQKIFQAPSLFTLQWFTFGPGIQLTAELTKPPFQRGQKRTNVEQLIYSGTIGHPWYVLVESQNAWHMNGSLYWRPGEITMSDSHISAQILVQNAEHMKATVGNPIMRAYICDQMGPDVSMMERSHLQGPVLKEFMNRSAPLFRGKWVKGARNKACSKDMSKLVITAEDQHRLVFILYSLTAISSTDSFYG